MNEYPNSNPVGNPTIRIEKATGINPPRRKARRLRRDARAIDALIAWSLDPDAVGPDEARRARADAWGYNSDE